HPCCTRTCFAMPAGQHARPAALSRAQEHPAHGQVHRNGAGPVQEFLEGLTSRLGRISATASERWQRPDPWPRTLCLVNAADVFRTKLRRGCWRVRAPPDLRHHLVMDVLRDPPHGIGDIVDIVEFGSLVPKILLPLY